MTLILTVPTRLRLMAYDSDTRFAYATEYYVQSLDAIAQRPAVIIEDGGGDYPPVASNILSMDEPYKMIIIGRKFTQGSRELNEAEIELRELVRSVIVYFAKRPRLEYSNYRLAQSSALGALRGVQSFKMTRENAFIYGSDGDQFWGCRLTIAINAFEQMEEIIQGYTNGE